MKLFIKHAKKQARKGESEGLYQIGLAYVDGKDVPENPYKAIEYMAWAAELEHPLAQEWMEKEYPEIIAILEGEGFDDDPLTQAYS